MIDYIIGRRGWITLGAVVIAFLLIPSIEGCTIPQAHKYIMGDGLPADANVLSVKTKSGTVMQFLPGSVKLFAPCPGKKDSNCISALVSDSGRVSPVAIRRDTIAMLELEERALYPSTTDLVGVTALAVCMFGMFGGFQLFH